MGYVFYVKRLFHLKPNKRTLLKDKTDKQLIDLFKRVDGKFDQETQKEFKKLIKKEVSNRYNTSVYYSDIYLIKLIITFYTFLFLYSLLRRNSTI